MEAKTDRVALVTGASSGIGEAAARALVGAGFTVYGTSRRATAGEKRGEVVFLPLDVTDDESVADAVREVLDRSGRIDVLVNNAGLGVAGAAEESSLEQARALFETNLFGSIRMTRAVCRTCASSAAEGSSTSARLSVSFPSPTWRCTRRASTLSRATPSRSTTRCASTESASCWSSPGSPRPRSTRISRPPTHRFRSTPNNARSSTPDLTDALKAGDEPSIVAHAIVAAATDERPKLRYPAGKTARRVSKARRYAPTTVFDKQIRKLNQLPACRRSRLREVPDRPSAR